MSTYGDLRKYTVLYEGIPPMDTVQCPNCYIRAVPRAASSGGYHLIYSDQEANCPNCGHVYGRNDLIDTKVKGIVVRPANAAPPIIDTEGGTSRLEALIAPFYAENKTVTGSIENGTGEATIDQSGLVTALANGTVIAKATATDGSGVFGQKEITISNQEE